MSKLGVARRSSSNMTQPQKRSSANMTQAQKQSSANMTRTQSKGSKLCAAKVPPEPEMKEYGRKPKEFTLPAFSLPYKMPKTASEMEKLRKKTIRRNAPPGEDLKEIKNILRTIKGQDVSVQEFLGLVGPSTGDQGLALKEVMNDDLASFRKLARKVYEMITKDNSDVLLNQQMDLADFYRDRKEQLRHSMLLAVEQIYDMYPNFDFGRYCRERDRYLDEIFPIPDELKVEPEELEMLKRQQAYHRLQWLRSEGERLNQENNSLKKRLCEMKRLHSDEQKKAAQLAVEAQNKRAHLEAAEAQKQDTLDMLNESLEKTIIGKEKVLRMTADGSALAPKDKKNTKKKCPEKKRPRPEWKDLASAEIDELNISERTQSESTKLQEVMQFSGEPARPRFGERPPSPEQVKAPAINTVMRRRRVQTPADSWGGF